MESVKNPFLESIAKRDRERKLVNEKNQRARVEKSEKEDVDFFDSAFDKKVEDIESKLISVQPSDDASKINDEFVEIAKDLQEVQRYFTSSTLFLTDRKIQQCQIAINQLTTKYDEMKEKLVPKKKFGFKNKSTKPQNPTKSAEKEIMSDVKDFPSKQNFLWTEAQKSNQLITIDHDKSNNQDLTLKELENCLILIKGHPGSLQMSKMKNCLLLCGPVSRSIFADACENCTFAFTCQQLRLHSSSTCDIYMKVTSRAIIEDCREICFAPCTYSYDDYSEDLEKAGLDGTINNWENIGDFNWLSEKQSPNWSRISTDRQVKDWNSFVENFKQNNEIDF